MLVAALLLFKKGPSPVFVPRAVDETRDAERTRRIRCPLCRWQPTPDSSWACRSDGSPEPFFGGCGTIWNTFATRGRCPGCGHRWRWTSCLRCEQWSLHEDWYEEGP
jgi:DNA-directed RNA polymerase subunit RPC12/RpoP